YVSRYAHPRWLDSFPTRRSSDLAAGGELQALLVAGVEVADLPDPARAREALSEVGFVVSLELRPSEVTERADVVLPVAAVAEKADRKSTRLNSSHVKISYAVFCL